MSGLRLFLFSGDGEVFFERGDHGWRLGKRSLDVERQSSFFDGAGGITAEGPDLGAVLLELGIIIEKTFYTAGRKKANDIVFTLVENGREVIADGAVHERSGETTVVVF